MTRTLLLRGILKPRRHWVCEKLGACTTAFIIIYFRAPAARLKYNFFSEIRESVREIEKNPELTGKKERICSFGNVRQLLRT